MTAPAQMQASGTAADTQNGPMILGMSLATLASLGLLLAAALVAPFVAYPVYLMKVLAFALWASAFNLLLGFAGLLSFGHAAYFGFSAYVTGHALKVWGFTPEISILFGTIVATILGAIIGSLAIRRQGIYFAMITLAFAQMIFFICLQAPFTGGEDGIQTIPRGTLFGLIPLEDNITMYYFTLVCFIAGFALIYRIIHSPFGQVLKAIRENEARAISLGYSTDRYKLAAFIMSAAISGFAGGVKVIVFGVATLIDVEWRASGLVVLMTLIGGIGTIWGPSVGAFVIVTIENYADSLGAELGINVAAYVVMIQGAIFVLCVLLFRRGIIGELNAALAARQPEEAPLTGDADAGKA